jgi:hypothetical protein
MEQLSLDDTTPGALPPPQRDGAPAHTNANRADPPLTLSSQHLPMFVDAANVSQLFEVRFLLQNPCQPVELIRKAMVALGHSVQVEEDGLQLKICVFTMDPGAPLSYAVRLGMLAQVVVVRRAEVWTESPPSRPAPPDSHADAIGLFALAPGQGFAELFRQRSVATLVVDAHIGEMGPDVLIEAICRLPNRRVIILPNHHSLVGVAQAAAQWFAQEPCPRQVVVIPNKSIPQGVSAAQVFNPHAESLERLLAHMQEEMALIDSGEVTQAVRNAEFDGITVDVGDFIGLHDGRLVTRGEGLQQVVRSLLDQMAADESRRITIYYGDFISAEAAENLIESVRTHYPEAEVKLAYGGQTHYHYILSTE